MQWFRTHLSLAISVLALFIALGGASYAALKVPKHSVGPKQIKKNAVTSPKIKRNAVTSSKVKDGSLRSGDFGAGQLPAGPPGEPGAPGADGMARAYARVLQDGTLVTEGGTENKGISQEMVQKNAGAPAGDSTGPGVYCFGGLGFKPKTAMVALDNGDALPTAPAVQGGAVNFIATVAVSKGPNLGHCDAGHQDVRVAMERVDQTNPPELVDHQFFIWFE
jgi:hypothetical protein